MSPTIADSDNAVRLLSSAKGHVESHFIKANSPDGRRALWLKHTLLVPTDLPEQAVGEVWAVTFERKGSSTETLKLGAKRSFPLRDVSFQAEPFRWQAPCAILHAGKAEGELAASGSPQLKWSLRFACAAPPFRPFPSERMYTGRFPRSKSLTPYPDARFGGELSVNGDAWDLSDFVGCQGHNWGTSHAHAYAWVHGNAWRADGEPAAVWFEALTGKVRAGPWITPWLTAATVSINGTLHRFDGPRAMIGGQVTVDDRSLSLELRQGGDRLQARFWAETQSLAGLRYEDPDHSVLACLNSKLASGEVALTTKGRTWSFKSDQVALELGTRNPDHGVTMLV